MKRDRGCSVLIKLAGAVGCALLISTPTPAQTQLFEFQDLGPPSAVCFAASAGDLDGDGTHDVIVSGNGLPTVHSGFDGTLLLRMGSGFPSVPALSLEDVTGDGVPDFLTGASLNFPVLQAYSGASGAPLYQASAAPTVDLAAAGDLNGDGVPDFCHIDFQQPSYRLRAFSGANGSPLWTVAPGGSLSSVAALGTDVTGDAIPEIVLAGTNPPLLHLRSGSDGALIWGTPLAGFAGVQDVAILADTNGSLVPDVAAIHFGAVSILEGADGSLIRSFPTTPGQRGASAGDVDADGIEDILLGEPSAMNPIGALTGAARLYSGATGTLLWTAFGKSLGEGFGSSVDGIGDITGDGAPDVVAGTLNGGAARVLSGVLLPQGLALSVGAGCSPAGASPSLTSSPPVVGETFTTFVTGAYTLAPVFVRFCPIPASPLTLPNGCALYTQIGSSLRLGAGVTSPSGTWVLNTPVPYVPSLIGLELAMQATVRGQPRYQLTNGLHVLVGL